MEKFTRPLLFYSNSLDVLFEILKDMLFSRQTDVFSTRLLLVPNSETQKWIKLKLADHLGICAGIQFSFLKQGIELLINRFFQQKSFSFPSQLELIFNIEKNLRVHLSDPLFESVSRYIQGKEIRLVSLSKHLAILFQKYGIYSQKWAATWLENPQDWQQKLWQKVFQDFDYPLSVLPHLELKKTISEENFSLSVFSFSHLSALHFNFFQKLAKKIPVVFYQLSACQEFWSDLSTMGKNAPDAYSLDDPALLLAHFGKVGREMAKMVEDSDNLDVREAYVSLPKQTTLDKLKSALLLLQKEDLKGDDSLQFHVSTTPYREMQNLKNTLLFLMKEKSIEPKDIAVMAPDISLYAPYIRAFFSHYQILDLPAKQKNPYIEGLFLLFKLDQKRWTAAALLELFEHPLFLEKLGWTHEEIYIVRQWVDKTGIRWGFDAKARDSLLEKSHCSKPMNEPRATWRAGIERLLYELAVDEREEIDFTQAEILGDLAHVLENLHQDLAALYTKKTLLNWTQYLKKLMSTYFADSDEKDLFLDFLQGFAKLTLPDEEYSFTTIETILDAELEKQTWTENPNHIQAICFSSIQPMRCFPAKVICLIGMNSSAFQMRAHTRAFDLLNEKQVDYAPTRADFDRYFLIEVLLAAGETLIISYLENDDPPCALVSALQERVKEKKLVRHPAHHFDAKYFDKSAPDLKSSSLYEYQLALRFSHAQKKGSSFFIHEKKDADFVLPEGEKVVTLTELVKAVRSPLKHYLTHAYACRIKEEALQQSEEAFTLDGLNQALFRKTSFKASKEASLEEIQKNKNFPLAAFGKLATQKLEEEWDLLNKARLLETCTLELLQHQERLEQIEPHYFRAAPVQIPVTDTLTVLITGKMEGIFPQGMIVLEKATLASAAKVWPSFLLATAVENLPYNSPLQELFFVRDLKAKSRFFTDARPFLKELLLYFFFTQETPLLLNPEFLEPILKKDVTKLQKYLEERNFDPLVEWVLRGRTLPLADLLDSHFYFAEKLYGKMYDAWF